MPSKKYVGKTCAFCRTPGSSITGDHVFAREFFLVQDRADLPQVPVCWKCNNDKSKLEHYALSMMPLGSRHPDVRRYSDEHLTARLDNNQKLKAGLIGRKDGTWERNQAGFLVPSMSVDIDINKILPLFGMIVAGLVNFHFGEPLDPAWYAEAQFMDPRHEQEALGPILTTFFRNPRKIEDRNWGRGTCVYRGVQSSVVPAFSIWQFTLFGGMQFTGVPGRLGEGFSKVSGITRPREEAGAA